MKPAHTINSAQRVLRVWKALRGHTLTGLSNQELAQATGESAANVSRALATLMAVCARRRHAANRPGARQPLRAVDDPPD